VGSLFRVFWWRFLVALLLVCLTYNPTQYNYVRWAYAQISSGADKRHTLPLIAFVGVVLLIAWLFYVRTTARSLGGAGVILAMGLCATVYWVLANYGVVNPANSSVLIWIALILFSAILAMGMSWPHVRRIWAGQADVQSADHR
jgi:FtsH-binding integral membrane protein